MSLSPPTPEQERREEAAAEFYTEELQPFAVSEPTNLQPTYEDIEHFDTFKELLCALPVQHVKVSEVAQPRDFLTALIGKITPDFLEGIGELRASAHSLSEDVDWAEMMTLAAQVGSKTPQPFFNKLRTPVESNTAPLTRHVKCELDYLLEADTTKVGRKYNVVGALMDMAGPYVHRVRAEWTAALIKLVHLCVAVFKPAMRGTVGTRATVQKRLEAAASEVSVYSQPHAVLKEFIRGRLFDLDIFVYEMLTHLALPDIRLAGEHVMLDAVCMAEYHAVRCAIDASSSSILYVCLMSEEYILNVWEPYMRLYFPRAFVADEEWDSEELKAYRAASTLPPWKHLMFYLPSPHQIASPDPECMIPFLQDYFSTVLTPEFRASFVTVTTPPDYTLLRAPPGEIFTVCPEITLAARRSKRTCATATTASVLKRTRTK